jgi:2,4-dienoyl-CoA reductase-like NADH-dependent reductase (Old Yellow Enzyme family)
MKKENKSHGQKHSGKEISRKTFLKTSAASVAALALPFGSGCSKKPVISDGGCLDAVESPGRSTDLFQPSSIGSIQLNNRFIRSATTINSVDDLGRPTDYLMGIYEDLCRGGVGMIITGMMDTGLMIDDFRYDPAHKKNYKKVPDLAHQYNVPIINQISHQGSQTAFIGSGAFNYNRQSDADINELIDRFVEAIVISRELGFDGVQLHVAHGYLLSETLSPAKNKRRDKWGGATEKRFTMIREIISRARKKAGGFPIFAKINGYDFQKNGMTVEEAVRVARLLEDAGCACIEVSSGVMADGLSTIRAPELPLDAIYEFIPELKFMESGPARRMGDALISAAIKRYEPIENYNVCVSKQIKSALSIPVMVVGGIKNIHSAMMIRSTGAADFISLSRSLIIEPHIVESYRNGLQDETTCTSCCYCIIAVGAGDVGCSYGGEVP